MRVNNGCLGMYSRSTSSGTIAPYPHLYKPRNCFGDDALSLPSFPSPPKYHQFEESCNAGNIQVDEDREGLDDSGSQWEVPSSDSEELELDLILEHSALTSITRPSSPASWPLPSNSALHADPAPLVRDAAWWSARDEYLRHLQPQERERYERYEAALNDTQDNGGAIAITQTPHDDVWWAEWRDARDEYVRYLETQDRKQYEKSEAALNDVQDAYPSNILRDTVLTQPVSQTLLDPSMQEVKRIKERAAQFRGQLKDKAKELVVTTYGLIDPKSLTSPTPEEIEATKERNREILAAHKKNKY
ncbi:hypothetical protein BDZ97DRAFT_1931817 [Flammula alnicola]|nr:hypothetical protein BDZ97DRAFT_1931817 [Flammula alnicola]